MEKPTTLPVLHPATGVMQQAGQSPVTNSTETLAQITVTSRIPEFWKEQPRLWFVQFEAVLANQKLADDAKYNLLVAKLNRESIQQISDIVLSPPAMKKYEVLKERLLTVYEESEIKQVQKLLSDTELGDQRPSQLLRKMRDLARNKFPDDTLRILWTGHLPSAVRAVLSVSEIADLDKLAVIADKVCEASRTTEIAEVSSPSSSSTDSLAAEIAKLSIQVAELQRSRRPERDSYSRNYRDRSRSRSAGRQGQSRKSPKWLCYYHFRYGNRAAKCVEPCSWKQGNPSGPTSEN